MIDILRNIDGVEEVVFSVASDNATVIGEIMGREEVNIDVIVDTPLVFAVGDYVRVDDTVYTLNRETSFDKKSDVEYRYDLLFESPLYRLLDKLFVHPITGLSTFTISRTLAEWIKLVVDCINEIDPGWTVAVDIPLTEPKNLSFDSTSCREALNRFVSEFGVEFFLIGKEIHFVNRIENRIDLVFEQGKGKGLYTISQEPVDNENTITRIFPYGGSQNVAPVEGDAKGRLCLPEKYLENFSEYSKIVEKEVEFKDIFPKFIGSADTVSGDFNRIIRCLAIDFDIAAQAIGGTPVKMNILTGDLMGESFEFSWKNETKEITLIRREDETALLGQDGKKPLIPSELRKVKVGDSFNFTDLNMPATYKENAVIRLREKATEWLAYYSRSRVKFTLEVDHRYLRGKHVLKAGDLVTIKIPETGINKLLRITSIERNLKTGKVNCTVSNYLDEKWEKKIEGAISDLRSSVAGGGNTGGMVSTLEIIESTELGVIFATDKNVYSALSTDIRITEELEDYLETLDTRYLRKDKNDEGAGFYTWKAGWMTEAPVRSAIHNIGWEVESPSGWYVSETGAAWYTSLNVRGPILSNNIVGSPYFASGWTGFGTELNLKTSSLELDYLTVRKTANFYELVFNQIRGTNGSLLVSDENKIKKVEDGGGVWRCTIDDEDGKVFMNFRAGDVIRCQTRDKYSIRYYMSEILHVSDYWFEISKTPLEGKDSPQEGDVVARWSNTTDINRKGLLYLTSSDSNSPYLDVRHGNWNSTVGSIKARLGRLDGINDPLFPELYGTINNFGLYTSNFYGTGDLILRSNGQSVSHSFEVLENSMNVSFNELREEIYVSPDNVLQNSTFLAGTTDYWEFNTVSYPLTFGAGILLANGSPFSDIVSGAQIVNDGIKKRSVLQVVSTTVRQRNANFNNKSAGKYTISFSYRPIVPFGTMTVGIEGSNAMNVTLPLSDTSKWQKAEISGEWDGAGDFIIQVMGGGIVNIIDISFADDRLTNAINAVRVEYDTKLSVKADGVQLNTLRDEYDEFNRVVRRDYATQTWTATKIESEVGTIVDGKLLKYATITLTSVMINNKVVDLNLGQYATTTWTASQITNAVGNIDMSSYATTTWTSSQITSSVSNKADREEVQSIVDQRYDFLVVGFEKRVSGVEGVTEAFYKFDINRMSLNRRIETGTGTKTSFTCQAGLSPNTDGIAFWAGGTYNQAVSGTAKTIIYHDGTGKFTGKIETSSTGNRITIDSGTRTMRFYNSADRAVIDFGFAGSAGSSDVANLSIKQFASSGGVINEAFIGARLINLYEGGSSDPVVSINTSTIVHKALLTYDPKIKGWLYRSGNYVMISNG